MRKKCEPQCKFIINFVHEDLETMHLSDFSVPTGGIASETKWIYTTAGSLCNYKL